ncbi:MAG: hypothetical protein H0X26_07215 [Alphaproteobacteria bacterium]|nr:hypothetical protein [Alphaproteobacteria bacterium]
MHTKSVKTYRLIKAFTDECLDKRTNAYRSLKNASNLCRQSIEKVLGENPALKKLIDADEEQGAWIKELIINYTLLKMQHHAILWEIDDHKPTLKEPLEDKKLYF